MNSKQPFKPELLLPVGNPEAFHAALKAGADAVYLGLKSFNARGRATNFNAWQVKAMVQEAQLKGTKVYITLNTVIRNTEIAALLDTLFQLQQIKPDALIVQDWGNVYLLRKYFPELTIHASTQMGNHNSAGLSHAKKAGIERVVLARELTKSELEKIATKSHTETELFIHGALCYSFSGMCLFSSFLGGASANRGNCAQPCRRIYAQHKDENYFFSLKDKQLIDHLPFIKELKINSLKVEGRLKSAEYVYQVGAAYRKAIDMPEEAEDAKDALLYDLGRTKTDYFIGKNVGDAITQDANTGKSIGEVIAVDNGQLTFSSTMQLPESCRLRIKNKVNDEQSVVKVRQLTKTGKHYSFEYKDQKTAPGDEVFLAGLLMKFPSKINSDNIRIVDRMPFQQAAKIKADLKIKVRPTRGNEIYIRIDSLDWLRKIRLDEFDGVLLNFTRSDLEQFNPKLPFIQQFKKDIWIELPKFISENHLGFYKNHLQRLKSAGLHNFSLSHLSQKEIIPGGSSFMSNENVYVFNDAAARMLQEEGVKNYIYPLENDLVNLAKGSDRNGIVCVYYYPQLFYSRMPVKAEIGETFEDKRGEKFTKLVRDGITIVLPENPVSLLPYKNKLERYGFKRFLIDMSGTAPSKNTPLTLKKRLLKSEQVQPSSNFNFKRELK